MSGDYFARLDTELGQRVRDGAHLARAPRRLARRLMTAGAVTLTLAAALVAEFPASAHSHPATPGPTASVIPPAAGLRVP